MLLSYRILKQWWKTWGTLPVLAWVKAAGYYKTGQFTLAAHYYEKGLKQHPNHPAENCARLDLSYCLFKQFQFDEAERHLRHVIHSAPENREAIDRLGKLQMWTSNFVEAAWTYRRGLQRFPEDLHFVFAFIFAVLSNGGPGYLLREARHQLDLHTNYEHQKNVYLRLGRAMLEHFEGRNELTEAILQELLNTEKPSLEGRIFLAEILLEQGKIVPARSSLRQALVQSPNNPRILNMLASSYLIEGPFFNPSFARQLSTVAAQNTAWLSPFALHTLADAHLKEGDRMTALVIASKAKDVGNQRLGAYKGAENLNQLIERLSGSTLA